MTSAARIGDERREGNLGVIVVMFPSI